MIRCGSSFTLEPIERFPFLLPIFKKRLFMKKYLKIVVGTLLIPTLFVLFYLDRAILLFLPWQSQVSIQLFYKHIDNILISLWRVVPIAIILTILYFIF